MTHYTETKMAHLDIPPIPEFIEVIADSGSGRCARKASVELLRLEQDDFIPQVKDILPVGEFHSLAPGGHGLFT